MRQGGFFYGNVISDENGKKQRYCFAWGTASTDAKLRSFKVNLRIKWQKRTFLSCSVFHKNPFYNMATEIKRGDLLLLFGTYIEKEYRNKFGEEKVRGYLDVDFILPAFAIVKMKGYADALRELSEDGDPLLSVSDFTKRISDNNKVVTDENPFKGAKRVDRKQYISHRRT